MTPEQAIGRRARVHWHVTKNIYANIIVALCGIISNGGLLFNQGTIDAQSIGYAAGSNKAVNNTVFTEALPAPAVHAADPCPTVAGCAYLTANPPTSGSCEGQTTYNSASTITIYPGKYCSTVIFEGGGAVVFSPGVYDFQGGIINNNGSFQFRVGNGGYGLEGGVSAAGCLPGMGENGAPWRRSSCSKRLLASRIRGISRVSTSRPTSIS
jgi:hypothetical protein